MLFYNQEKKVIQPNKTLTDFFKMLKLEGHPTDYKWYADDVEIHANFNSPIFTQVKQKSNIALQKIIPQTSPEPILEILSQSQSQPNYQVQQQPIQPQNQQQLQQESQYQQQQLQQQQQQSPKKDSEQSSPIKYNQISNPFLKQQSEQQTEQQPTLSQSTGNKHQILANPFQQLLQQQLRQSQPATNSYFTKSPEIQSQQNQNQGEVSLQSSQMNQAGPKKTIKIISKAQTFERKPQPTKGEETSGWKTIGKYQCNIVNFGNEIQIKSADGTINAILKEEMFTPGSSEKLKFDQSEFSPIEEHKIVCNGTKVMFFRGLNGIAVKWATGMQCKFYMCIDEF